MPETTALNLLSLPSEILATRQLVDSVGKTLSKQGAEATTLRDIYSRLIEQTLLLVNEVKTNEKCKYLNIGSKEKIQHFLTMQQYIMLAAGSSAPCLHFLHWKNSSDRLCLYLNNPALT